MTAERCTRGVRPLGYALMIASIYGVNQKYVERSLIYCNDGVL